MALFWTTRRAGIALFGEQVGEWGAIMFATIPATFALASIGLFDMTFAALLFGGVACLIEASPSGAGSRRREIAGYALLAFAVMIEGAGRARAGRPLLRPRPGRSAANCGRGSARCGWKTGLICAALAASPWFVWMYVRFGDAFVQGYVLAGNLYYFTQPESWSSRAISHAFYLRVVRRRLLSRGARSRGRGVVGAAGAARAVGVGSEKLLWLWTVVVVGFFSLARFKLDHYIFPAAPSICLLAVQGLGRCGAGGCTPTAAPSGWSRSASARLLVVAGTFISVYIFELDLPLPTSAIAPALRARRRRNDHARRVRRAPDGA